MEEFPKPDRPVYDISDADMISYFPKVVRWVFKKENVSLKGRNIWALKKKDADGQEIIVPPFQCPRWNDSILNSNYFFGSGKAYKFGNKLFRQKLQIANFMMAYDIIPDDYCKYKLDDYVPRNFTREELVVMGSKSVKNPATKASKEPSKKSDDVSKDISSPAETPCASVDLLSNMTAASSELVAENEEVQDDDQVQEETSDSVDDVQYETPVQEEAQVQNESVEVQDEDQPQEEAHVQDELPGLPRPTFNDNVEIVTTSQEETNFNTPNRKNPPVVYGTPAQVSPPKTYFGLLPGSLKKTFLGNKEGSSLVFQVLKIERDDSLKCFRARISDGSLYTEYVLFYQNLGRRVKTLQECNFPFISVIEYDILASKYLAIADFKYIKSFDQVVGTPENIDPSFFTTLQEGLKGFLSNNRMRGILERNVPSSTRKRLPPAPDCNTPPAKRTRVGRIRAGL